MPLVKNIIYGDNKSNTHNKYVTYDVTYDCKTNKGKSNLKNQRPKLVFSVIILLICGVGDDLIPCACNV